MPIATRPPALIGRHGKDLTGVECRILRAAVGLERRHLARIIDTLDLAPGVVEAKSERTSAWIDRITAWEKSKGRGYPAAVVVALTALEDAVQAWALQAGDEAGGEGEAVLYRPLGARHAFALLELDRYGLTLTPAQMAALDNPNGEIWLALADTAIVRAALYLRPQPIRPRRSEGATHVELDRTPDEAIRPDPAGKAARRSHLERLAGSIRAAGAELSKVMDDILAGRQDPWIARLWYVASETLGAERAARLVAAAAEQMAGVSATDRDTVGQLLAQAMASGRLPDDELFSLCERAPVLARSIVLELNGGQPGAVTIKRGMTVPSTVIAAALLRLSPTA